ncbi:MAG: hypothetical protein HYW77_00755 [Parcubacteria group bacterium]|nr:hypothetical protein [Parcubacteria group bacterium]
MFLAKIKKQNYLLVLILISLGWLFLFSGSASAFCPLGIGCFDTIPIPEGRAFTLNDVSIIIETIGRYLISLSVLITITFIIWGGIMYMNAGSDSTKLTSAKTRIKNGIIGAVIVLGVGVILRTIASILTTGRI